MMKTTEKVGLTVLLIATAGYSAAQDRPEIDAFIDISYINVNKDDGVDAYHAYQGMVDSTIYRNLFGTLDTAFVLGLEQHRVSIGADDAVSTYLNLQVGPGYTHTFDNGMKLFGAFQLVSHYEWFSLNGVSQNENGRATYWLRTQQNIGLAGEAARYDWRLSLVNETKEALADRSPLSLVAQAHVPTGITTRTGATMSVGLRLQASADKQVAGVSLAF